MDANMLQRSSRASSLAVSPTSLINDHDDWDTVSLTSTVYGQDSATTEYVVEGIHAEDVQDGRAVFLIEWANFPLDECTWEPLENLSDVLKAQWEHEKATRDPSVSRDFVAKYEAAYVKRLEESRERHHRRNAIRRRRGIPTTHFYFRDREIPDSDDEVETVQEIADSEAQPSGDSSDESREAEEDNAIDTRATKALGPPKPKVKKVAQPENRIFKHQATDKATTVKSKGQASKRHASPNSTTQESKSSKQASRYREPRSATGYQGSARKSSTGSSAQPIDGEVSLRGSGAVRPSKIAAFPRATVAAGKVESSSSLSTIVPMAMASGGAATSASAHKPTSGAATVSSQISNRARLSGQSAMAKSSNSAPNVLIGGRKRKQKASMSEIELDTAHPSKHYKNHAQMYKSVKRSRERADQGPPIHQVAPALFAPGGVPFRPPFQQEQVSKESVEVLQSPKEQRDIVAPSQIARSSSMADIPVTVPTTKRPQRSSFSAIVDRSNKKAKSVRFTETELGPSTPQKPSAFQQLRKAEEKSVMSSKIIGDDDGLFVGEPMEIDDIADSPTDEPVRGSVTKKIKFSTSTRLLTVSFDAFPTKSVQDTDHWIHEFLGTDCLNVGHTFLAETLVAQLGNLSSTNQGFRSLGSGVLKSKNNSESLEVVAEHLRLTSSGLFVAHARFNLVLFPTKCADFDKLSNFGVKPVGPESDHVTLQYFIFGSDVPIVQLMRPSSGTMRGLETAVGKEKLLLFPTILGMQYSPLIAPYEQLRVNWHFYLSFPERAVPWQHSIASWLSTRNPKCKVYTNFDAGSWLAFSGLVKRERDRGVLIIHEALVPFIRRFPQLHKLLKSKLIVWQFSEALSPDTTRTLVNNKIVPVLSTRFSRIFPVGHVILLTPSFLLSEPQEVFKLLQWFFTARTKSQSNKLVLAYNIVEYLSGLSSEKAECRHRLDQDLRNKSALDIAAEKSALGLTDHDMAARQKIWFYLDFWLSRQTDNEIPFSDFNAVIFADRSIDPNDEQSLVNWFGMWSMAHCREYRRFYVAGSKSQASTDSSNTVISRATRAVTLPKYHSSVVHDPDEALRNTLRKAGSVGPPTYVFESLCFQHDETQIKPWLVAQSRAFAPRRGFDPFWILYTNPVSWVDGDMAKHLGESAMDFATIKQWWDSIQPWTTKKNTYIALFHTIYDEWHPENFPKGKTPKKHTWLAIWRPCEVHDKAQGYLHGRTELIIWDVRAGAQLEAKIPLGLDDLTWMQRALVKYIQDHADGKNPGSYLNRVWVGGFQAQVAELTSQLPVDQTAELLVQKLLPDPNNTVPSPFYALRNKYRQINTNVPNLQVSQGRHGTDQNDLLLYGDENDPNLRIIFHPPRGTENLEPETPSRCTNNLFEASRLARLQYGARNSMVYTFPPTMTWYQNQMAEGRQFDHIMVDEWDKVFVEAGVDARPTSTAAPIPASATSAQRQADPSRKSSMSSNHSSSTY